MTTRSRIACRLTLPAAYLFLATARLTSAAEPANPPPPVPVQTLAEAVLATNPEFKFYQEELAAVKAGVRIAGSANDPELSVAAGRKRARDAAGTVTGEGTVWAISLSQTFEWPGRLALRKAIANREVALAELGLARFQAALSARVRTLAYGLLAAQEQAAAAAEVAERFRALKETFLARDPAGLTPLLDTRVIEAQELALQRRATEAALAAQAALVELNQLRGLAVEVPLQVAKARILFHAAPSLEALLAAARDNHFEFQSKKIELEQQGFVVQLARNERRPALTVSPFVSREAADGRETTVGLGLSVPLPLAARNRAGVDAAEARRRQAEAAVLVAQREMEREVIVAAQTFSAKLDETARWAPEAAEKFREAAELADRHYRLNAVPLATYVGLQTAYLDAVDALLDTKREALEAGLRLQLLTGLNFNAVAIAP